MTAPPERPHAPPPRGVLRTAAPVGTIDHQRILPSPSLAPRVAHFWWVRWSLREPFTAQTLPHPSAHVVFESSGGVERAEVAGVSTARFSRELVGDGWVFGVKFRPAAFHPLWGRAMCELANRVLPLASVFGEDASRLRDAVFAAEGMDAKMSVAEGFLCERDGALPAEIERMRDLVERMSEDRALRRAEDAAAAVGLDLRTLQRHFQRYVGATPKWVIQRYRLHEAAAQLGGASPPSLASLASALGYADQAHFARDFKAMVGVSPRAWRASRGPSTQSL